MRKAHEGATDPFKEAVKNRLAAEKLKLEGDADATVHAWHELEVAASAAGASLSCKACEDVAKHAMSAEKQLVKKQLEEAFLSATTPFLPGPRPDCFIPEEMQRALSKAWLDLKQNGLHDVVAPVNDRAVALVGALTEHLSTMVTAKPEPTAEASHQCLCRSDDLADLTVQISEVCEAQCTPSLAASFCFIPQNCELW